MAEDYFFVPTLWRNDALLALTIEFKLALPDSFSSLKYILPTVNTLNNSFYLFVNFHVIELKIKNIYGEAKRGVSGTKKLRRYGNSNGKIVQTLVIKNCDRHFSISSAIFWLFFTLRRLVELLLLFGSPLLIMLSAAICLPRKFFLCTHAVV